MLVSVQAHLHPGSRLVSVQAPGSSPSRLQARHRPGSRLVSVQDPGSSPSRIQAPSFSLSAPPLRPLHPLSCSISVDPVDARMSAALQARLRPSSRVISVQAPCSFPSRLISIQAPGSSPSRLQVRLRPAAGSRLVSVQAPGSSPSRLQARLRPGSRLVSVQDLGSSPSRIQARLCPSSIQDPPPRTSQLNTGCYSLGWASPPALFEAVRA
jgi:hypothetical protein